MSNAMVQFTVSDMQGMARAFVDSNMFGVKNVAEALSLLLIAQAEGLHPAQAMRDFHVIQGKPALKADAMMARFQHAGGVVQWEEMTDKRVAAYFSHPTASPKPVLIEWTDDTVQKAQLSGNPMHKKYPRQMKRARVISDGVRTVFPAAISGFYTPEEVVDFEPNREPPKEIVKEASVITPDERTPAEVLKDAGDGLSRPQFEDAPDDDPEVITHLNKGKPPSKKRLSELDDEGLQKALETAEWRGKNAKGKYADKNKAEARADWKLIKAEIERRGNAPKTREDAPESSDDDVEGAEVVVAEPATLYDVLDINLADALKTWKEAADAIGGITDVELKGQCKKNVPLTLGDLSALEGIGVAVGEVRAFIKRLKSD